MATKRASYASAKYIYVGEDRCIASKYVLFEVSISDFVRMTSDAYASQGVIEGQRDVVRTATASRIRRRMGQDIEKGAVLPPIVLGTTARPPELAQGTWTNRELQAVLAYVTPKKISIIDGMQRTTVLREGRDRLKKHTIRVELWFAPRTDKLIYRMLILNTGQIPWTIRRQLEVVYRNLIDEIEDNKIHGFEIYRVNAGGRRTSAGEFQAHDIIEMYLAFSLRKPHVDNESALTDQFSRLDLIESVDRSEAMEEFVDALRILVRLDHQFAKAGPDDTTRLKGVKPERGKVFRLGRHIFDKASACAGFMAAYAQFVRGRVGMDREPGAQTNHRKRARQSVDSVVKTLESKDAKNVRDFLALDTLKEVLDKRAGGKLSIGENEREVFTSAFRLLFDEGPNLKSLEPCWRSQ